MVMIKVNSVFNLRYLFEREIKGLFLRGRPTRRLCNLRFLSLNHKSSNEPAADTFKEENPIVNRLFTGLLNGNRASLASAITLVETEHKEKKKTAQLLLDKILKFQYQSKPNSYRIGFSGPPGAGKSTFIEVFGKYLTSLGHKVAVLAVDPSSETSGGSLLGDKTRMTELTRDVNAFIRPSPAKGHLGGVTRSTNEAIILCEFTGYDVIIIETVGVGQSEFAVTNMVDLFILLLPPGGGDELQGVKRGIIERANILVVTKSDGDLKDAAHRTQYEYTAALKFLRSATPNWKAKVLRVSSKTKEGIDKFWETVNIYRKETENNFLKKRGEQRNIWMWAHVQEGLKSLLFIDSRIKEMSKHLQEEVREGKISPGYASDKILSKFKNLIKSNNIK